jgi:hypothetical protein
MEVHADRPLIIHTMEIFAGFGMDMRDLSVEIQPGRRGGCGYELSQELQLSICNSDS